MDAKPRQTARNWATALVTLAVCGGCWEEIHYTPPAETPGGADAATKPETAPPDAVVLDTPVAPPAEAPVVLEEPSEGPASAAPVTLPDSP